MLEAMAAFLGILIGLAPIIFIIYFIINTTMELKKQTLLLKEINKKLNR